MPTSLTFTYSDLQRYIKHFDRIEEIDVQAEGQWYINQVYRYVSKKHGRAYTYATPPASQRTNLRKRSGKLLRDLRDSKFSTGSKTNARVGFEIPDGYKSDNYLGVHVSTDGIRRETRLTPSMVRNRYRRHTARGTRDYIMIPLRSALMANGVMKPITPRLVQTLRAIQFHNSDGLNWGGEDKSKFHPNSIVLYKPFGRSGIPMYVLARKVKIPTRINLLEAFEHEAPRLVARIDKKLGDLIV